jgi:hypothetical protein
MSAAYEEVPFSELLHRPVATADRLKAVRALRLRRRDDGDLVLLRVDQMERDDAVVDFTADLLAGLVMTGNEAILRQVLPNALPWLTFLPDDSVEEFIRDLVDVTRGAASISNLSPIAILLTQWRHTAEVYADPTLLAAVTREVEGDFGPAQVPNE